MLASSWLCDLMKGRPCEMSPMKVVYTEEAQRDLDETPSYLDCDYVTATRSFESGSAV